MYLYNNKLQSLPKEIGRLINLQRLDLSYNELQSLPKEIGQLINLQFLNLNDNKLLTIPLYFNDKTDVRFNNNPLKNNHLYKQYGYQIYKRISKTLIYIQRMYRIYMFLLDFYSVY